VLPALGKGWFQVEAVGLEADQGVEDLVGDLGRLSVRDVGGVQAQGIPATGVAQGGLGRLGAQQDGGQQEEGEGLAHGAEYSAWIESGPMNVLLASPRGFCAGVERAIEIVERALALFGPPVYVWHEIVHNRHVVESLRAKGARFVESHDEVPDGAVLIFSAHGVSKAVVGDATARGFHRIDATCPLVTKVHLEAVRYHRLGCTVILIGHKGHPEVAGTMGQLPDGAMRLVQDVAEAEVIPVADPGKVAFLTQTTLSVDETRGIIAALKARFPAIQGPSKDDICYATQNRQNAVRELSPRVDALFVLGSPNSSNSNRLKELAQTLGARAYLVEGVKDIRPEWLSGIRRVGVTAGASAPEVLVQDVVRFLRDQGGGAVEEMTLVPEHVTFQLPAELAGKA
jgi:4-hydroxy-3-methylbut-2-enyl diphosphate reductase